VRELLAVMKALADPSRLRIVACAGRPRVVPLPDRELLGLATSTMSRHLTATSGRTRRASPATTCRGLPKWRIRFTPGSSTRPRNRTAPRTRSRAVRRTRVSEKVPRGQYRTTGLFPPPSIEAGTPHLPPRIMTGSCFCFAEGLEPFRLFWKSDGRYFVRQLDWTQTRTVSRLAKTPVYE